jgi:hypothetical protein
VLKPSLESWFDNTIGLQGVDLDFCRSEARSIQAFRSGRAPPDKSWKISNHLSSTNPFLVRDHLVWLAKGCRQVNIVNLRSMSSRILVDPSRGEIGQLHAADDLVAFTARSRGVVFVGKLNGQGLVKSFRIHSSRWGTALTCRHRTVACAMHFENHALVYIWDYDTSQCRSFEMNRAALQIPMSNTIGYGLLLQPNTKTIVLCQFLIPSPSKVNSATLLHWRFTYAGECLRSVEQVLEGYDKGNDVASGESNSSLTFVPASYDGIYMLQCNYNTGRPAVRPLQYNEGTQAFTSPPYPRLYSVSLRYRGDVSWWKDTFIEAGTEEDIVVHRGTFSVPNLDLNVAYGPGQQRTLQGPLINDRYIVQSFSDAFYVFCYDHTVQLPRANGILQGVGSWELIENRFPKASTCRQVPQ